MNPHVWLNGDFVDVADAGPSVASISLSLGVGVFDGIRAYRLDDGFNLHLGRAHVERFLANTAELGIPCSYEADELLDGIDVLLSRCEPFDHYVRPIAFKKEAGIMFDEARRLPTSVAVFALPAPRTQGKPITCRLSSYQRISGNAVPIRLKVCGAYINSTLAHNEAVDAGFGTGLMLDSTGHIAEAATSNMFFFRRGRLITPLLTSDVFPGLTRALILTLAREIGIEVEERHVHVEELRTFDGAMLTGTLSEVQPIPLIDDMDYQTEDVPEYKALCLAFNDFVEARR